MGTNSDQATETPEEYMLRQIADFRERIGIDFPEPLFNLRSEQVTLDGIRRFAYGVGDDNPLFVDRAYAQGSRWGGIVAPPYFLVSCGRTRTEFAPTPDEAARGKDALVNHNLMHCGGHMRWFGPVREGDAISVRTFYTDCVLKGTDASGWVAISTFRQVFWNQREEVVCIWDVDAIHPYNQPKVDFVPPPRSADYLGGLDEAYDSEVPRGAEPRYVESVAVGDETMTLTKGPLATSDIVAWAQGAARHDVAPNRLGRKKRRAGEMVYMQNAAGGWDSYMSVHWDPAISSQFGMTQPFDWGMIRTGHMLHLVSDWVGDDGIVVEVRDRIRAINVLGNIQTVSGRVTGVATGGDWPEVTVEVRCTNQDGVVTASATARVRLPSERRGLPEYPNPPADQGLLPSMRGYVGP